MTLEVCGRTHGPRPIEGSLVNEDGKGQVWILALGSIRGRFVANGSSEFTKAISEGLVSAGRDLPALMRTLVEMSPTVSDSGI
jgi:hypothetical protein